MRPQVVVLGPIEREMYLRLDDDLLSAGTKHAKELSWRTTGCGVEVSERLVRLGLSVAILTGIGAADDDRAILAALRKRGIHTRGARSGASPTPTMVRVKTPRHEVRMASATSTSMPSKSAVLRALPGSRHFHVCGSILDESGSAEITASALARASHLGASTSLDIGALPPTSPWATIARAVSSADVLFADSQSLRALVDEPRIGAAARCALELGASAVAVSLASGGSRVYTATEATRIPRMGEEVEHRGSAFAAGFLLGWLLGSRPGVCGVMGAAEQLDAAKPKLPDRRELAARMLGVQNDPALGKLVPLLADARRVLDQARRLPRRDLARPNRQ